MRSRWLGTLALAVVAAVVLSFQQASAAAWSANFNLQYGRRSADASDWKPVDHTSCAGIEATWGPSDEELMVATDLYYANGDKTLPSVIGPVKTEVKVWELAIGLRKVWIVKWLRPYAGAGVSLLHDELDVTQSGKTKISGKDNGTGIWVGAGIYARLLKHLDLGVYARYTPANHVRLMGSSIDASSGMVGIGVGWGWGEKAK